MYPPVILANNALLMTTDDKYSINSVQDEIMAAAKKLTFSFLFFDAGWNQSIEP